ncbi:hypothetical protein TNCV_4042071 [Trichonephila clavipes]|nr:hypothetical protein TNCV_4042071 [Trichonephila clavipes]
MRSKRVKEWYSCRSTGSETYTVKRALHSQTVNKSTSWVAYLNSPRNAYPLKSQMRSKRVKQWYSCRSTGSETYTVKRALHSQTVNKSIMGCISK